MTVETFDIHSEAGSIVKVSESAAQHFFKQVEQKNAVGVRLSLKQAGCTGYKYIMEEVEQVVEGDLELVLLNGVKLYVDVRYLSALQGTEIDIQQQGLNLNLIMQNPNVKDECGCGESFSIQE